jgi:hypothetical protein
LWIAQSSVEGRSGKPKKFSSSAQVVLQEVNTTPSIGIPRALPLPGSSTEKHVKNLLKMQEDSLRDKIMRMSKELVHDLEARLTAQIQDVKLMAIQGLERNAPLVKPFQAESGDTKSTTEEQIKDMEANASELTGPKHCLKNEPESVLTSDKNLIGALAPLQDNFLLEVSDHVIERVNADPRICQLVENHQSIQESFAKLLYLMEEKMPTDTELQVHRQNAKNGELYNMMNGAQKCCKSIALELRQLRQRCNQDVSQTALRFEALEERHRIIEDALILDKEKGNTKVFESDSMAEANDVLTPVKAPRVEVESDRSTMSSLISAKHPDALNVLRGGLLEKYPGFRLERCADS